MKILSVLIMMLALSACIQKKPFEVKSPCVSQAVLPEANPRR